MTAPANVEVVRQPVSAAVVSSRGLQERLGVRFPRVLQGVTRAWQRLPPRSRLRQALMLRTVRLGIDAANRRDYEVAFGLYDPGVELIVPPGLVAVGFDARVQGRDQRIRFEQQWRTQWGEFRYAPQELIDLGSRVLVIGHMQGRGPSSGAAFDNEWAVLFTVAGGQVVREQVFLDHDEALEAVG